VQTGEGVKVREGVKVGEEEGVGVIMDADRKTEGD
jgi:hypothetical protein